MGHCVSRRIGSAAFCGLCLLIMLGGLGCARHEPTPVAPTAAPAPPPPAPAREVVICKIERETAYDRGLKAYEAGEGKRAMVLWREAAGDPELAVRQKAWMVLAASRPAALAKTSVTRAKSSWPSKGLVR